MDLRIWLQTEYKHQHDTPIQKILR